MGQSGASVGCRRTGLVVFKNYPVARPDSALRRVIGPSAPGEQKTDRARLFCLLHWGSAPSVRRARLPNRGVRERLCAGAGCHATPGGTRSFCCEYREPMQSIGLSVCRQRGCARGVATARQSSFSQLKLSENRRKHFLSPTTLHIACNAVVNAFQQYEWLARLATAKLERRCPILELAHPPLGGNGANSLEIHDALLLKSRASRQEKASACNRNCAAADEHFCDDVVFDRCADVDAAGP
jgi:hypothetical protein